MKISVSKEVFDGIAQEGVRLLVKKSKPYWAKEFLEPKLIDNTLEYTVRQISHLTLCNGLGGDKPSIKVSIEKVQYNKKEDQFEFIIKDIVKYKNTDIKDDKDLIIQKLLEEKALLEKSLLK
ncbi:MAG: hypothetical protein U9N30_00930 [Campylobacterota bacterium]|nr:hypothetical protein [Campylobacterota bacterium]